MITVSESKNESQARVEFLQLLSSTNEVWVGHRNAGRPSVLPSVRLVDVLHGLRCRKSTIMD